MAACDTAGWNLTTLEVLLSLHFCQKISSAGRIAFLWWYHGYLQQASTKSGKGWAEFTPKACETSTFTFHLSGPQSTYKKETSGAEILESRAFLKKLSSRKFSKIYEDQWHRGGPTTWSFQGLSKPLLHWAFQPDTAGNSDALDLGGQDLDRLVGKFHRVENIEGLFICLFIIVSLMYGRLMRGVKSLIAVHRGGREHSIFHFLLPAIPGGSPVNPHEF